jgi:hypothetical protein
VTAPPAKWAISKPEIIHEAETRRESVFMMAAGASWAI